MIKLTCALIALCLLVAIETEAGNGDAPASKPAAPLSLEETLASLEREHAAVVAKKTGTKADLRTMLRPQLGRAQRQGY